jgi:hypothetical protein
MYIIHSVLGLLDEFFSLISSSSLFLFKDSLSEHHALVQRQFIKRYGDVFKLIVSLNKSSIHTDIVGQIEDLIDDTNDETAIH